MGEFKNPFAEENFVSGGGLWDGKVITIIEAKTEIDALKYGDGSPVLNDGQPAVRNVLSIVAIADGDERERRETYSAGSVIPTADGEGFTKADGSPAVFHSSTQIARFIKGAVGFDWGKLWDPATGRQYFRKLVGARFEMKGVEKKDKNGKVKTHDYNGKKYTDYEYYPVRFVGYKAGAPATTKPASDVLAKGRQVVLDLLAASDGGKLTQVEVVRGIGAKMNGDPDRVAIVSLVTKPEFHDGAPWKRDGSTLTL